MKPSSPGELVQIDTLFGKVAPNKAVKHSTAYDPIAKWTLGLVAGRSTAACATVFLDKLLAEAPFPVRGIQVDVAPSSAPASRRPARIESSTFSSCRPSDAARRIRRAAQGSLALRI